jgi:branched-chain amino acid transport system ATP-binding protein
MSNIALSLKNVKIRYGAIEAVKGVSFDVEEGSAIAIVGANGAGKSSVIRAISGLTHPSEGKIELFGRDITRTSPEKITKLGIGQSPEGRQIFPLLTVEENLQVGAYCLNNKKQIAENFEKAYSYFPILKERRKQYAGTMSGGELQMLAIARALMSSPKIIMFDEPSLGLAPLIVQDMFRVIHEIKESGTTIILVEQNAVQSLKTADYGYVMAQGAIQMQGSAEELLKDSAVLDAYLGTK